MSFAQLKVSGYLDSTVALGRLCFEELSGKIDSDFLVIDQLFPGGATIAHHLGSLVASSHGQTWRTSKGGSGGFLSTMTC
jgi:hypothetical protein